MQFFDCIIIGNGSIGMAIAHDLSQETPNSFKISIFGKKNRIGSASLAAGAMINVFGEIEYDTLKSNAGMTRFKMLLKSKDLWTTHVQYLKSKIKTRLKLNKGTFILNNSSADELDDKNFQSIEDSLKLFKEKFTYVKSNEIKGYDPKQRSRSFKNLYIPNERFLSSAKDLLDSYDKILEEKKNISFENNFISKIIIKNNRKIVIDEKGNKFECKFLIIASGSYANKLIKQIKKINKRVPDLFFGTGNAIIASSDKNITPDCVIRTPNRGMACGLHVVPLKKNHVYIGASNRIADFPNDKPLMSTVMTLQNSLIKEINQAYGNLKIKKICVGHRPTTSDTFPILGETSIKGLYITSGTKRDGLSMSLFIAKCISNSMLNLKNNYKFPNMFKPERKIISTMSLKEGIEKSVKHRISAAYQHDLELPKTETEKTFRNSITSEIKNIYSKCKIKKGVPPELLNMYLYKKVKNK
jgi:glycine oxidase